MIRSLRRIALFATLGLIAVSRATAAVPSAANSTVPQCLDAVGSKLGVPDPAGTFTIHVRDNTAGGGVAMIGVAVILDFATTLDVRVCANQLDPLESVDCPLAQVCRLTDAFGNATFKILAGSVGPTGASSLGPTVTVWANATNSCAVTAGSVNLGMMRAGVFDLDGVGGVGANDLSIWFSDFGSGSNWNRSDYDCSGSVGANDLSAWLGLFATGNSTTSCVVSCP